MPTNTYKKDFPFFHDQELVYLDNAATTQKPQAVLDAMNAYYTQYCANTHRGSHDLGNRATQEYEDARKRVAQFIGADTDELVFTRGTTESINLVASTYVKDNFDTVILTELEHHSNILPWQLNELYLEVIPLDKELNIDLDVYESIVQDNPNSFIAITHISNAFGILNPVQELVRIAHKYGCKILIDGAQALAHLEIDVKALDVDFYAVSAHKAYGPTGIGALYGKRELLERMSPYQGGGSMIDDVSFEYSTFLDPPFRFEAGTQAIAEAIGFSAALAYLNDVTGNEEHDKLLLSYAKEELKKLDDIELYTDADNVIGNISFNIKGLHHDDIGILLSKQKIMLRTGHHCALPIMKRLGIKGTVRLSFALYNTTEDIDICIKALHKAIKVLR